MEYRNVNLQKLVENPQGNTSGKHQQIMVGDNQSHPWHRYIYIYIIHIYIQKQIWLDLVCKCQDMVGPVVKWGVPISSELITPPPQKKMVETPSSG